MNILLRLKHWQLFLTFVPYYFSHVLYLILASTVSMELILKWNIPAITTMLSIAKSIIHALWLFVLAKELNKKHPLDLRMNLSPFLVLFVLQMGYQSIYAIFNLVSSVIDMPEIFETWLADAFVNGYARMRVTVFNIVCIIYLAYFLSKSLVLTETQRKVSFTDHFSTLLAFVFYPIGVWFIQPRVNRLFSEYTDQDLDAPLDQHLREI